MRDLYPEDEKKYKWLPTLLDAYEIADEVNSELLKDKAKNGVAIACSKGCNACCKRPSVPFTAPELMGISWFASEKLSGPIRSVVKQQLRAHESTTRCPFLVEEGCSIYPVRPLACRQFFMAGMPCRDGEEIMESRPQDIVIPSKDGGRQVAMKLLEHFGITKPSEKLKAFNSGFIVVNSKQMHEYDWNLIADTMDIFDQET
ncbi:YkgJ family cysteine cluster protein [Azospira oryzae]|uniref:YkgJ family cysteine cluster protein n=1 Tax=Azospira oryzae TaxID=146939 RepID=UPI001963BC06|nr:YkgJ family cysteine cluster protein [Azospira oryzae]